jgi:excisionase family DNA binding protein
MNAETNGDERRPTRSRKKRVSEPGLLSVLEAAAFVGVHEKTVRGWMKDEHLPLPFERLGPHQTRIRKADLEAFIARRTTMMRGRPPTGAAAHARVMAQARRTKESGGEA